ncbi:MAG: caspase family protein [bacterium]
MRKTAVQAFGFAAVPLGLAVTLAGWSSPALAAKYGLVVGINAYQAPVPALAGAVNDANDIADALTRSGARQVIKLTDEQATRAAVTAGWETLLGKAKKGDTIVFTYAGHGSQEPAGPGDTDEVDGFNENFLLARYAPTGEGVAERLIDNDIAGWLADAKAKGVRVVFVADACHSGTMFRNVSLAVRYRAAPKMKIDKASLAKFAPPAPKVAENIGAEDPITFLAAVPEDRLAPELEIDGMPRGGLSWAFARSLEGSADTNRDGRVTEQELTTYIRTAVQQRSDSQQITQSFPPRSPSIEVLAANADTAEQGAVSQDQIEAAALAAVEVAVKTAAAEPIKLAYKGGDGGPVAGAEIVTDLSTADLVYDASARTVEKAVAGIVAEDVDPEALPGIVAKWRAIAYLKATAGKGVVPFTVDGDPRTYARGEKLNVSLTGTQKPFMTLFNLPPNGRVEFLYPVDDKERAQDWRDQTFSLPLVVRDPPFGSEHLIAIMSEEPLDALHTDLRSLKGDGAATLLPDVLSRALEGHRITVGLADVYTSAGN